MKSKYFKIHELVPKKMYEKYDEKAWRYINPLLIESIDTLKEIFHIGAITVNNYYWGGNREWSGIRLHESKFYSDGSQHTYGNAIDAVFSAYSVEEVRNYIIDHPDEFPHVKGIELGVNWLHMDVRNEDSLVMFRK